MRRKKTLKVGTIYPTQGDLEVQILSVEGDKVKGLCLTEGPYYNTNFPYDRSGTMLNCADQELHPLHLKPQ